MGWVEELKAKLEKAEARVKDLTKQLSEKEGALGKAEARVKEERVKVLREVAKRFESRPNDWTWNNNAIADDIRIMAQEAEGSD